MQHELAYHLHMPVYKLQEEMPYDEYVNWHKYFEERPVDWRDDQRFMTILQSLGIKESPGTIFSSLKAIGKSTEERTEATRLASSLKASAFFQQMLGASEVPEALTNFAK